MLILEKWKNWKAQRAERDDFSLFVEEWADEGTFKGVDVIYQLYLMQVCVEGLLEDVDALSELVTSLKDKATGKRASKKSSKEIN